MPVFPSAQSRSAGSADFAIVPPDGGWGWLVVFASFYCQLIIDGIQLSFGMVLKEMADFYNVEYSNIALIGSIIYGMHYVCGPLCAGLSCLWGDRIVCMIGAVMSCICISIAYFQPPIYVLYLVSGVFGGLGLGFANMTSIVVPTLYFSRRRFIAVGIVVCGTGVGTMLFAFAANFVLRRLSWQYVCLIEGLLCVSMVAAAATFRPLVPSRVQADPSVTPGTFVIENDVESENDQMSNETEHRLFYLSKNDVRRDSQSQFMDATNKALEDMAAQTAAHIGPNAYQKHLCERAFSCSLCCGPCFRRRRRHKHHHLIHMNPASSKLLVDENSAGVRKVSIDDIGPNKSWLAHCLTIFTTMLDCKILTQFSFLAYCVAVSLSASALIIVLFYEKVRFIKEGLGDEAAMLYLVWVGGTNMVWRLILGCVSTIPTVNYQSLNVVGLLVGGAATMLSGVWHSFWWTYLSGALYGLAIACFAVFYPVICVELVGRERVLNATGIAMMFMGILSIVGAPISGLVYELTGSLDSIFYIAGGMFMLSGTIFIFITGHSRLPSRTERPTTA